MTIVYVAGAVSIRAPIGGGGVISAGPLDCEGSEQTLADCTSATSSLSGFGAFLCSLHIFDAGVICLGM